MKYTPDQIEYIQNQANERITELLDILNIEYTERTGYIQMSCPIHGSDNPRSLYFALKTNHWRCATRHCEQNEISGKSSSVFGLIRGILSNRQNRQWNFIDTVNFIAKLLNLTNVPIKKIDRQDIEINKLIKTYKKKIKNNQNKYSLLRDILPKLKPDTEYYPKRGVSQDIINKYHISFCCDKNKPFYNRSFFPVLDETGKFVVGWSGRTIWPLCAECRMYHDPKFIRCPDKKWKGYCVKWKHSLGFKSDEHLYNIWSAKKHIGMSGIAIVCESPGNVWTYEKCGITNSVALMGLNFSKTQRQLLQKAGALTLIITLDNDKAGLEAKERFEENLQYYFRLIFIYPENVNDIAEMLPNDIKSKIGNLSNQISYCDVLKDSYKECEVSECL